MRAVFFISPTIFGVHGQGGILSFLHRLLVHGGATRTKREWCLPSSGRQQLRTGRVRGRVPPRSQRNVRPHCQTSDSSSANSPSFTSLRCPRRTRRKANSTNHELKRETAEAKGKRIVREDLKRLRWSDGDLSQRPKSDPAKLALRGCAESATPPPGASVFDQAHWLVQA
jgi:hypothetical protein